MSQANMRYFAFSERATCAFRTQKRRERERARKTTSRSVWARTGNVCTTTCKARRNALENASTAKSPSGREMFACSSPARAEVASPRLDSPQSQLRTVSCEPRDLMNDETGVRSVQLLSGLGRIPAIRCSRTGVRSAPVLAETSPPHELPAASGLARCGRAPLRGGARRGTSFTRRRV